MRQVRSAISLAIAVLVLISVPSRIQAQRITCPNTPPTRLAIGMSGQSTDTLDTVRVRAVPNRNGKILASLSSGQRFTVVGGPKCADGYLWWQIKTDKNATGWAAEGDSSGYFIQPTTTSAATASASVFGKNGSKIAFMRADTSVDPYPNTIVVMNADGTNQQALTKPDWKAQLIGWLPDGKRLLYTVQGKGFYTMNADGSGVTQVGDANTYSVAWSPDGQTIAYGIDPALGGGEKAMTSVLITDANPKPLTLSVANPIQGVNVGLWSPDGKYLLLVWDDEGGMAPTYTLQGVLDLSAISQTGTPDPGVSANGLLTFKPPLVLPFMPVWADNQHFAYIAYDPKDQLYGQAFLAPIRTDTSPVALFGGTRDFDVVDAVYAPDGKHFGVTTCVHGTNEMQPHLCNGYHEYVIDADGTNPIKLSDNGNFSNNMTWSPDGQFIAYSDGGAITIADFGGHSPHKIGEGYVPKWQP